MMWETLHWFDFYWQSLNQSLTVDLTPYMSSETQIGFFISYVDGGEIGIDNVDITVDGGIPNDDKDPFGHGTHVAGVLAGDGNASYGLHTGVAPGAPIVSVRVLDAAGRGDASDVIAGLDWVLDNAAPRTSGWSTCRSAGHRRERRHRSPGGGGGAALGRGIVVVCSAGNYGSGGNFTITSPGNSPKVITVGSITDSGTGADFTDDYVSTFSSHGADPDRPLPEARSAGPGEPLRRADSPGQAQEAAPGRVKRCNGNAGAARAGEYLELSGTSMAAAEVSATAALMLSPTRASIRRPSRRD